MEKYYVIENKNIGSIGNPEFVESILFVGTKTECLEYEDAKRKEYKDLTVVDCFVQSESDRNRIKFVRNFWDTLTDEEKEETIIADGRKYNKALYNFHHGQTIEC